MSLAKWEAWRLTFCKRLNAERERFFCPVLSVASSMMPMSVPRTPPPVDWGVRWIASQEWTLAEETTRAGDYETKGETLHTDGEEGSQ